MRKLNAENHIGRLVENDYNKGQTVKFTTHITRPSLITIHNTVEELVDAGILPQEYGKDYIELRRKDFFEVGSKLDVGLEIHQARVMVEWSANVVNQGGRLGILIGIDDIHLRLGLFVWYTVSDDTEGGGQEITWPSMLEKGFTLNATYSRLQHDMRPNEIEIDFEQKNVSVTFIGDDD